MKKYAPLLVALYACICLAVAAAPLPPLGTFKFEQPGDTVSIDEYNLYINGVYQYLNNNVVAVLNRLTNKGDLYTYTGIAVQKLSVGANTRVLTADSTQSAGLTYTSSPLLTGNMTAKGDIPVFDGSTFNPVPVGTDALALTANSTTSQGIDYEALPITAYPAGAIIAWTPRPLATSAVPTGWALCNGQNNTPNLIGLFVLGGKPNGDSQSSAGGGGFGAQPVDKLGSGTVTHLHTIAGYAAGVTTTGGGATTVASGTTATVASPSHEHTFGGNGYNFATEINKKAINTDPDGGYPSYYVLVYIIKTP